MTRTGLRKAPQTFNYQGTPYGRVVTRKPKFKREKVKTLTTDYKPVLNGLKPESGIRITLEFSASDTELLLIALKQLKTPHMKQYNRIVNKLTKATKTSA